MSVQSTARVCSFPGCDREPDGKLCGTHGAQLRRRGFLGPIRKQKPIGSPPDIASNVDLVPCPVAGLEGPCWIWKRSKTRGGYGHFNFNGKFVATHRYTLEKFLGRPLGAGMVSDHRCRVPACCNPDHLREVTRRVNVTENIVGANWQKMAAKTHCIHGHEYTAANTMMTKKGRECRVCRKSRGDKRTALRTGRKI